MLVRGHHPLQLRVWLLQRIKDAALEGTGYAPALGWVESDESTQKLRRAGQPRHSELRFGEGARFSCNRGIVATNGAGNLHQQVLKAVRRSERWSFRRTRHFVNRAIAHARKLLPRRASHK